MFSAIALIAFSFASMANANNVVETTITKTLPTISLTTSEENNEEDWWFCYEVSRKESFNFMTMETTVTITYKCRWYTLT